jgi:hypothetical protein
MGQSWSLLSFQPAAFVGDDSRWNQQFRQIDSDDVWSKIEEGVGRKLPFKMLQMGDERCNRTCWGIVCGDSYFPYLEETDEEVFFFFFLGGGERNCVTLFSQFRDAFFLVGRVQFTNPQIGVLIPLLRTLRIIFQSPIARFGLLIRYLWLFVFLRVGIWNLVLNWWKGKVFPLTVVMHTFMDADLVREAHVLNKRNEWSR